MDGNQKDSHEPQNTPTEGNSNELATVEEDWTHDHIKSFIEHLKNLTDELKAQSSKAESQYRNAVKIKEDWAFQFVTWDGQYDSKQIELAELITPNSPRRQRWQGR